MSRTASSRGRLGSRAAAGCPPAIRGGWHVRLPLCFCIGTRTGGRNLRSGRGQSSSGQFLPPRDHQPCPAPAVPAARTGPLQASAAAPSAALAPHRQQHRRSTVGSTGGSTGSNPAVARAAAPTAALAQHRRRHRLQHRRQHLHLTGGSTGGSVGGSTGGWLRQRVGINGFLAVHSRGQVAHSLPGPRRAKRVSKASTAARLLRGAGPFTVGSPPGSGPAAPAAKRVKLSS